MKFFGTEPEQPSTPSTPSQPKHVFLAAAQSQGPRNHQEDRHTIIQDFMVQGADTSCTRSLAAVFDGHAGHTAAKLASRKLHEYIASQPAISSCSSVESEIKRALKKAFLKMDEEIIQEAEIKDEQYGSTAVLALRIGHRLYVAHLGDSRAVLCWKNRGLPLTQDHKPASAPEERERIEGEGGEIQYDTDRVISNPENDHQSKLNMSRALGDVSHKFPRPLVIAEPDVVSIELKPEITGIVLGSDGLFDVVDEKGKDIASVVYRSLEAGEGIPSDKVARTAAKTLVEGALKRGTGDNVTAVVMLFEW